MSDNIYSAIMMHCAFENGAISKIFHEEKVVGFDKMNTLFNFQLVVNQEKKCYVPGTIISSFLLFAALNKKSH